MEPVSAQLKNHQEQNPNIVLLDKLAFGTRGGKIQDSCQIDGIDVFFFGDLFWPKSLLRHFMLTTELCQIPP